VVSSSCRSCIPEQQRPIAASTSGYVGDSLTVRPEPLSKSMSLKQSHSTFHHGRTHAARRRDRIAQRRLAPSTSSPSYRGPHTDHDPAAASNFSRVMTRCPNSPKRNDTKRWTRGIVLIALRRSKPVLDAPVVTVAVLSASARSPPSASAVLPPCSSRRLRWTPACESLAHGDTGVLSTRSASDTGEADQ